MKMQHDYVDENNEKLIMDKEIDVCQQTLIGSGMLLLRFIRVIDMLLIIHFSI